MLARGKSVVMAEFCEEHTMVTFISLVGKIYSLVICLTQWYTGVEGMLIDQFGFDN